MKSFQRTVEETLVHWATDSVQGLSSSEVVLRQQNYGFNEIKEGRRHSWFFVFIQQFESPLIYILLLAAIIIFFIGDDPLDAFIISGVLFFNAIVGTIQEGRTHAILQELKRYIKSNCLVIRDGKKLLVDGRELVNGDLVLLQEGQRIPADLRIIESNGLQIDESILTGESIGVYKQSDVIAHEIPVYEQNNMVFKGTYVQAGSGKGIVVAIGAGTQIGKVADTVGQIDTDMPLKKELNRLSYWILIFIFVVCFFLFGIGLWNGKPVKELLVMLTALFICVVPEGLPVALTLVLVTGAYRMARHNVLVKRMQAVEALGRADVIVIDKTGTLTRNEMMVSEVATCKGTYTVDGVGYHRKGTVMVDGAVVTDSKDHEDLFLMARAAYLLNSTEIQYISENDLFEIKGDPTEAGMYVFSQKLSLNSQLSSYKKVYEIPFSPQLRYHAGFFLHGDTVTIYCVGAPDRVMAACRSVYDEAQKQLDGLLQQGLRVIAVAHKQVAVAEFQYPTKDQDQASFYKRYLNSDLVLSGFFGIQDAIRPEVPAIVQEARNAGLKVVMATGDHHDTALYVAKKVGIFKEGDQVIDGVEIDSMADKELQQRCLGITVYSRVSPEHKLRIVSMYHQHKLIVAMTGDGINDAPALVAADLGIAMGNIGTEVAKKAADIVLLDDSFSNIIHAIEQGRHIFYTLRRIILYFFSTNLGEVFIVLFALMLNLPLPITAAQILWLNLVTDGFLDAALTMEPQEKGLLYQQWLGKKVQLIDWGMASRILFFALPMGLGSLYLFMQYYQTDIVRARTITLISMAMFQWFNAWNCRSDRLSLVEIGIFSNRWLLAATSFVLVLQFFLLHTPFMQYIFKTVPLTAHEWLVIVGMAASIFVLEELRKVAVRVISR